MGAKSVVGILFSNVHDEKLPQLTQHRTMASVPFGARYRLIDFQLSSLVNSGVYNVGVVTNNNFLSLMDHLGSGKAWDLSRKKEGLTILPPFNGDASDFNSRVLALDKIRHFLQDSSEKYVLVSDCDVVMNIDYRKVIEYHVKMGADITVLAKNGQVPKNMNDPLIVNTDGNGKVEEVLIGPKIEGDETYGLNIYIFNKDLLLDIVRDCASRNLTNFKRDVIQRSISECNVYAYCYGGYAKLIGSIEDYYDANMELMDDEVSKDLFDPAHPIYTKVRDHMPAYYGGEAKVFNSLVADGSLIDGEVRDSVLFRGVLIGKNTTIDHCIIMQDTVIGDNCKLSHVILDKDCKITDGQEINGSEKYPFSVSKGSIV